MSTPAQIIQQARYIVNDVGSITAQRQTDDELLLYLNDGLREMVSLLPKTFSKIGPHVCTGGARQKISTTTALRLLDAISANNGGSMRRFDRQTLDLFNPDWRVLTPRGVPKEWSDITDDPLSFDVYPPAEVGTVIDVQYVAVPVAFPIDQPIDNVPATLFPALVDYVVYRAESKDDEHVLNQRAISSYESFLRKLGVREGQDVTA